jgi:Ca2+-binding EF-hand superfamily protein
MGSRSSRAASTKWDLDRLAQISGLSRAEIDRFHSNYIKASGRDGVMDMNEFIQLYSSLPIAKSQKIGNIKDQASRIFRAFDQDHNGTLSFDEFLSAIVMMNYEMSRDDRIGFLIQENNDSKHEEDNERISAQYGYEIFRRLNDFYGLPAGTEQQRWKEVDRNNRGYVTQDELVEYISQQPFYNQH